MRINNVDIRCWNAGVVEWSTGVPALTDCALSPPRSVRPVRLTGTIGVREISFILNVRGYNDVDANLDLSRLIAAIVSGSELDFNDGYSYYYALSEIDPPERLLRGLYTVTVKAVGYRHGEEITKTITSGTAFLVTGNIPAPVIFTLTGGSGAFTISYSGWSVSASGISATLIIDGKNKRVIHGSSNGFSKLSGMTTFPALPADWVTITTSGTGTLTAAYEPVYF